MKSLIDADIVCWRAAFAAQETWYDIYLDDKRLESFSSRKMVDAYVMGDKDYTVRERIVPLPDKLATKFCDNLVNQILKKTGCDSQTLYLGGKFNFRKFLDPEYKANRKDLPKPLHKENIREHLIKNWGAEVVEYIEADDAIAIAQNTSDTIICSIDKDMKQVPGHHYHIVNDEFFEIDELEGWKNLFKQCLTGDIADNVQGMSGIGEKKATKMLADCSSYEELRDKVHGAWVSLGEPDIPNYHLLYMLRDNQERDMYKQWVRGILKRSAIKRLQGKPLKK